MHVDAAAMRPVLSRSIVVRGPRFYRGEVEHDAACAKRGLTSAGPMSDLVIAHVKAAGDHVIPCTCGAKAPVLFVNHFDASSRDGPREATTADAEAHPRAFEEFVQGGGSEPFRPVLSARDPDGGRPRRERGAHELRREAARERGEAA